MNGRIRITIPRGPLLAIPSEVSAQSLKHSIVLLTCWCSWFVGPDFDRFVSLYLRVVIKNIILERSVPNTALKPILLHLGICAFRVPAVVIHSVDGGHDAGSVTSAVTVNENRLISRVADDSQELLSFIRRRPRLVAQADSIELHTGAFD